MGGCVSCFSSSSEPTNEDGSTQPLLHSGEVVNEGEESRVVDRRNVPHTVINLPSPNSRPPPITFEDIPSPTAKEPPSSTQPLSPGGQELRTLFREAYSWKDTYHQPSLDFSYKTNLLFTQCEKHFSELSEQQTPAAKNECDLLVKELLDLREHWGPQLLPLSMRNAFVREKITVTLESREFKIDCIQFFEPIVFYGNEPGKNEDLVKLYVFVVTDTKTDDVVVRYYLERSYLFDFYHVLCYFKGNSRGQLKPYGTRCPPYWTIREHMYQNAMHHLKGLVMDQSLSDVHPIAATYFPTARNTGPVNV